MRVDLRGGGVGRGGCAEIADAMQSRRRRFWGWGWEDAGPNAEQQGRIAMLLAARLGIPVPVVGTPPRIDDVVLPSPRVAPPPTLAPMCSTAPLDRAGHTYGKS